MLEVTLLRYITTIITNKPVNLSSKCQLYIITYCMKWNLHDSDYTSSSRTDVSRVAISLIINQCDPRSPKCACAADGHFVSASRGAQSSKAHVYYYGRYFETRYEVNYFCNNSHCTITLISIRI